MGILSFTLDLGLLKIWVVITNGIFCQCYISKVYSVKLIGRLKSRLLGRSAKVGRLSANQKQRIKCRRFDRCSLILLDWNLGKQATRKTGGYETSSHYQVTCRGVYTCIFKYFPIYGHSATDDGFMGLIS